MTATRVSLAVGLPGAGALFACRCNRPKGLDGAAAWIGADASSKSDITRIVGGFAGKFNRGLVSGT